ncbi:MAG TPA: hypothetical protein VGI40_00490 [Pirellulaceae bacterium]|jgi:hypothetical protein
MTIVLLCAFAPLRENFCLAAAGGCVLRTRKTRLTNIPVREQARKAIMAE